MKKFFAGAVLCLAPILFLVGCGGGGGGGGSTPRPTPTPVSANIVVVQLRDNLDNAVDGIVTIGVQRQATFGGEAIFSGIATGPATATIEVNGRTTSENFTVLAGNTQISFVVDASVSPTPTATGTIPPPPFGG